MKPSSISAPTIVAALTLAGLLGAVGSALAADTPDDKTVPTSETVIVLASDTPIGPDMGDTDAAVRYYCSTHGKLSVFVSKERPPEMRDSVLRAWSVMTYRCVTLDAK